MGMFNINKLQSIRKLWPRVSKLYFQVLPLFLLFSEAQKCVHDLVLKRKEKIVYQSKIRKTSQISEEYWSTPAALTLTSFSAAVFSTNLEPWPGLPGQWMVIPENQNHSFITLWASRKLIRWWMCFILTPGVPFTIKHSEGFTGIGQTCRAKYLWL